MAAKPSEAGDQTTPTQTDSRFEFLASVVHKSLRLKPDRWAKLMSVDEAKRTILDFLDHADPPLIVFTQSGPGILSVTHFALNTAGHPAVVLTGGGTGSSSKLKSLYFLKKRAEPVSPIDPRRHLLYGDLSTQPLDQVLTFLDEIVAPILLNTSKGRESGRSNLPPWPTAVSSELERQVRAIRGTVNRARGLLDGKTVLYWPWTGTNNQELPSRIEMESCIQQWTQQLSPMLETDESALQLERPSLTEEIAYWKNRSEDLENIFEQLKQGVVRQMAATLEAIGSAQSAVFKTLLRRVIGALAEAQEIALHMKPIVKPLDALNAADVSEMVEPLRVLLHTISLLWCTCAYFRQPIKLAHLLRQIGHALIERCRHYLDSRSIFTWEIEEATEKITIALEIFSHFRHFYNEERDNIPALVQRLRAQGRVTFTNSDDPSEIRQMWNPPNRIIFERVVRFERRLTSIIKIFHLIQEFSRLSRLELSAMGGRSLTIQIQNITQQFNELKAPIVSGTFGDCMDPDNAQFEKAAADFNQGVILLESKVTSVVGHALNDVPTPLGAARIIQLLGSFLQRPAIQSKVKQSHTRLVQLACQEVATCTDMLRTAPAIDSVNEVAGSIHQMLQLEKRAKGHIDACKMLGIDSSTLGMKSLRDNFNHLQTIVNTQKARLLDQWTAHMNHITFNRPLLVLDSTGLIQSGADSSMARMLSEFRHLQQLVGNNSPKEWELWIRMCPSLRFRMKLVDLIVGCSGSVEAALVPSVRNLFLPPLKTLKEEIKEQNEKDNWSWDTLDSSVDEELKTMADTCLRLHQSMKKVQSTSETVNKITTSWSKVPIVEYRHDEDLPMGDQLTETLNKKYQEFSAASKKITSIVQETQKLTESSSVANEAENWVDYMECIDCAIVDGLVRAITATFQHLMSHGVKGSILYHLELFITEKGIVFTPLLDSDETGAGIVNQFTKLLHGVLQVAGSMTPLSQTVQFQQRVDAHPSVVSMMRDLNIKMATAVQNVHNATKFLHDFAFLWTTEKAEFLTNFLNSGIFLGQSAPPSAAEGTAPPPVTDGSAPPPATDGNAPPAPTVTLSDFQQQINMIEQWKGTIDNSLTNLEYSKKSHWLKLNVKPARKGIMALLETWRILLLDHVTSYVVDSVADLESFLQEAEEGLNYRTMEGDKEQSRESLLEMMGYLAGARTRQATTDAMFEPLGQAAKLLEAADHQLSEEMLLKLQNLPQSWENIKQSAAIAKQQLAALQVSECAEIRKSMATFETKQLQFREEFQQQEFFKYDCPDAYLVIDQIQIRVVAIEEELKELTSWATLFEVVVPEFKPLKSCRRECTLSKQLWDYVFVVRSSVDNWKLTYWKEIDVERLEIECKHYAKDIRNLDKEMRPWGAYMGLEASVRDLLTSLKAISDLQNPAVKERHWTSLIEATKRKTTSGKEEKLLTINFVNDSETTLGDLLALQLHRYEEEVRSVVDRAVREISMEKTLRELEATWANLELDKEMHIRTGLTLLKASDDLIAILEDNQVQLQTLATSKYVAHLMNDVLDWQRRLGLADSVLALWCEVQRSWSHLESIFAGSGSDDIRVQLPEDADRFDKTNTEFKEILNELLAQPNVIHVATRPGILDQLQTLDSQLQLCEKALAHYLESKRMAFPRFYFVATADLLDILSNGNNPIMVQRHFTKLFDAAARIKLEPIDPEDPRSLSQAIGIWAKDGEYVPLVNAVQCVGQVESWLNAFVAEMRSSLRHLLKEAVAGYDERPKDSWIWDYPAQVALTASQIAWNAEVTSAFQKLEEGYENAMKDLSRKQVTQLNTLVSTLVSDLSPGDRQKVMTLCTIDVHSRDVVARLVQQKVESSQSFPWQSQLRHCWSQKEQDCFVDICDARFGYWYEYLGNTSRLVVTPLTDRCYITLTQSLHLIMGGAPAGPAGTGKTETTKDLGRALGILVYVFNCSEQMDYKTTGNIYKGLAQTGAWGCFDEFNRISVEVLSVVAVQIRSILDALRQRRKRFFIMEDEIALERTVGLFVTMNPGYAGRSDLPENLKSLFRPCAMIVPDSDLICEIMLVAEGFFDARALARKLVTLYALCRQLLSKQDHYDWGLRAIKSVLVLAGSSKRHNQIHGWSEEQLLLGALRDANLPRLISDDVAVFLALLGDLFPSVECNRSKDSSLEKTVRQAACDLRLQAEDIFVMRVLQLHELLQVRHSIFLLGAAGTGKTQVWRTLLRTYALLRMRPICADLDPKAVTSDELFGYVNPTTREWKDGLLSSILREQAAQSVNNPNAGPKWIVLDGDIDPNWIESLNTLMDDNKVLTLASNERIALTPQMRLIFEISHLKSATPSSVSRAGILHLNTQDLGWSPYVTSWIDTRCAVVNNVPVNSDFTSAAHAYAERNHLTILMDKYVPSCLEIVRTRFKPIVPMPEICHLQMLCRLLDSMLTAHIFNSESLREMYELYFVFACVWAFGSALSFEAGNNLRLEFSMWWTNEFKAVRFPTVSSAPTIFDFYIDHETHSLVPWTDKLPKFEPDPDLPIYTSLVPTAQTTCLRFFIDMLIKAQQPILLIGPSGCGKTALVDEAINALSDDFIVRVVPMHYYMTSELLQTVLEKPLEKKGARNYGPPGSKRIMFFLDDFNSPHKDLYGTAQAHTLLRQHLSYGHWYDRNKLMPKEVRNIQYIACMNPTAGTFTIDPRLHRHFLTFAVSNPGPEVQQFIFSTWLQRHFSNGIQKFIPHMYNLTPALVAATMALHQRICAVFRSTASKFLYSFTLRDMSAVFKGLLMSTPETVTSPVQLLRMWVHEVYRVYADRLNDEKDVELFKKAVSDVVKKCYDRQSAAESALEACCAALAEVEESAVLKMPLLFCHFARGLSDAKYGEAEDFASLAKILQEALTAYNELNPAMELVLFEDAISHICRINRILELPRGHALLVGVGGSGKQSLARLAASVGGFDVSTLHTRPGYGLAELKCDLSAVCLKAGLKKLPTVLLITDAHLVDETLLGPIHDYLAAGEIPGLFSDDEVDNIVTGVRNEVKALGLTDSRDICWRFFLEQIRRHLHIILCCSPVGSVLRLRTQRFPALVANMSIDYFLPWPHEALISVSQRYLSLITVPLLDGFADNASQFMAYVHSSVNDTCRMMLQSDGRYAYTTPKSFLEQLQLFVRLLERQTGALKSNVERLENGLDRLRVAAIQVDELKEQLAVQEVVLQKKTEEAERLIQVVRIETEKVRREKILADAEEKRVAAMAIEVGQRQRDCEEDLVRAEPALVAAQEALNTLNKANLTELKSFGTPPLAVTNVTAAVLVLLSPQGRVPKDRSWKASKVMMGRVDQFLDTLITYEKEHIHPDVIKAIQPYMDDPEFDPELIRSKSTAAAGLCSWVINIIKFFEVFCKVEPKRRALETANAELFAAREKETAIKAKVNQLVATLEKLTSDFERANKEKKECHEEAERTTRTLHQANRLIHGLASEKVRWFQAVEYLRRNDATLPGDVLLTTAFVSYAGIFPRKYRTHLVQKCWIPFIQAKAGNTILLSESFDAVALLGDAAQIAAWNNEGLPADRMSIENAAIMTVCERWPLLIDPQLQGLKWVRGHYGERLVVASQGMKGFQDILERCLSEGKVLLIENISEELDNSVDPLMSRQLVKKGKAIKIADKEVDYHPDFKLIIHTKLANPHFRPELQAQATLLNFTVTRDGLEEQLLAEVVRAERPDLEKSRAELVKQENDFKIALKALEDDLLIRLSKAQGEFLADTCLVDSLEKTKATSNDIIQRSAEAAQTAQAVNQVRELYRPASARASLLFFIIGDLQQLNPIYQFSLKAFIGVFQRAIVKAQASTDVSVRVLYLVDAITYALFQYVARGLFEQDRLVFTAQMTFQILLSSRDIDPLEVDFFLRFPVNMGLNVSGSPVDFLSPITWNVVKGLSSTDEFRHLDRDIEASPKRWRKIIESEFPERERLPQDWKSKSQLRQLCILRALRPDRVSHALCLFIEEKLGSRYVESLSVELAQVVEEMGPSTPLCFILSPGVNPLLEVEILARRQGRTEDNGRIHLVSLGQGQEASANFLLNKSAQEGHWVILQNIHLVKKWLPTLERMLERFATTAHSEFKVFMSVQPPGPKSSNVVPQGLLESCIKLTSEPPRGIRANLHMALDHFNQESLEQCTREAEFKTLLFALCYFHAVATERRHFGAQGWNRPYPFSAGDLTISVNVLLNYIEGSGSTGRVPWEDLRYLLGEIMYGGHVTDDWDRRLCRAYLEELLQPDLLEGELFLAPNFPAPPNRDYAGYHRYIDEALPPESTYLYGLHPNAEIGILTRRATKLCQELLGLQPRTGVVAGSSSSARDDRIKQILDEVLERLPEEFSLPEICSRLEEKTPFMVVIIQECERMNALISEAKRSLRELDKGLKGELSLTPDMEEMTNSLYLDQVPHRWAKLAYPSLLGLTAWIADLQHRHKELDTWLVDFQMPNSVWLGGFFSPQAFLTAVMQTAARRAELPLDRMALSIEVTKKMREEITAPPREGVYIHGLYLEGARWDSTLGVLAEAKLKELHPAMPVIYVKGVTQDKLDTRGTYECPVYQTQQRGPSYVWNFHLKTKDKPSKWILAGTAILLLA